MNLKRRILLEYRKVFDASPEAPYLHARSALPERLGVAADVVEAAVRDLEQGRFLHWKAQNLYKLSARGLKVTGDPRELDLECPDV